MTVFVLISRDWDDSTVEGVFRSRAAAELYANTNKLAYANWTVEEHLLHEEEPA